jgi:hypothetical protein
MIPNESHTLEEATDELIDGFSQSNPELRLRGNYRREVIGGRDGLTAQFTNRSDATGEQELVTLSTIELRDGSLLYLVGVAPQNEAGIYDQAFRRARQTLRLTDSRTR